MPINYDQYLSDDQKRALLSQRVQQFCAEAYQHELNLKLAKEIGNTDGVAQAEDALVTLEAAITLHQEELAKLPAAE